MFTQLLLDPAPATNTFDRSKEEREEWENADPEEREKEYIPQKYNALRKVPAWGSLINERFERCMVCGSSILIKALPTDFINRTSIWRLVSGKTGSTSIPIRYFRSCLRLLSSNPSPLSCKRFSGATRVA
jgi:hypothetical protein